MDGVLEPAVIEWVVGIALNDRRLIVDEEKFLLIVEDCLRGKFKGA